MRFTLLAVIWTHNLSPKESIEVNIKKARNVPSLSWDHWVSSLENKILLTAREIFEVTCVY